MQDITVTMVARNAAPTVGRAVKSALAAGAGRILLVDDASTDETAAAAKQAGGDALRLVRNDTPVSVAHVRGLALDHIETPYALWLDADDELAPGHIEALAAPLFAGIADIALGAAHLIDGETGEEIKPLPIPDFMLAPGAAWRSFERNWYPSLHAAFRTDFARNVGYDPAFECAEDYDFLLRCLTAGARIEAVPQAGYRYYHYAGTISRNREKTKRFTARALSKHDGGQVTGQLLEAGFSAAEAACILMSKAMFEGDLARITALSAETEGAMELSAPYGLPVQDIAVFFRGTAALIAGDDRSALGLLQPLAQRAPRPEFLNNLAVAQARAGHGGQARSLLEEALALLEGYVDARTNLAALKSGRQPHSVTTHPLRLQASRDTYVR